MLSLYGFAGADFKKIRRPRRIVLIGREFCLLVGVCRDGKNRQIERFKVRMSRKSMLPLGFSGFCLICRACRRFPGAAQHRKRVPARPGKRLWHSLP
jgi:hypothetical protein